MIDNKKYFFKKLQEAKKKGVIRNIDFYCCTLLIPNVISEVKFIILYLSYATHWGHSCLPIHLFKKKFFFEKKNNIIENLWNSIVYTKYWFNCILDSKFCGNGSIVTPLVIQKKKIYLYRYWNSEKKIIDFIMHHKEKKTQKTEKYPKLFKEYCTKKIDKIQKIAIGVMLLNNISFILGGPGTGKTTIISYLILFLIKSTKKKINIQITAPTGKAVARITEVIYQKLYKSNLTKKEKKLIPKKGKTLHRLFNIQKNTNEIYLHKYTKKIFSNIDLLIIDESSMIDLYMMENIANIIQKKTKIIFLGDINQLPPIEVGSVIKEICKKANNNFSKEFSKKLSKITQQKIKNDKLINNFNLNDTMVVLKKKYRFNKTSGIGIFSTKLEEKNNIDIYAIIKNKNSDLIWKKLSTKNNYFCMLKDVLNIYQVYWSYIQTQNNPKKIIDCFNKYRILCALLHGPFGINFINNYIEKNIHINPIQKKLHQWYHGRPIIITKNNISLKLFNGEIGICLFNKKNKLKVFFLSYARKIKTINPSLIKNFEVAWSTTIHKAQGSEFSYVTLILPNYISKTLSKELIYTGITRAKKKIIIYSDFNILNNIINIKKKRYSGIYSNIFSNNK